MEEEGRTHRLEEPEESFPVSDVSATESGSGETMVPVTTKEDEESMQTVSYGGTVHDMAKIPGAPIVELNVFKKPKSVRADTDTDTDTEEVMVERDEEVLHAVKRVVDIGFRETTDLYTGKTHAYAPAGSSAYEEMVKRYDKRRGRPMLDTPAGEQYRRRIAQETMAQCQIRVPASAEDIVNPAIEVTDDTVEPGGPIIPTRLAIPDPKNPLHTELLWKQKNIRLYEPSTDEKGRPTTVSVKDAMVSHGKEPYRISREELVRTYQIKSPKVLAIESESLNQAIEFYAANLQEHRRESSLIPMIVPLPWLLFVYDPSPKGLSQNSYTLISKYLMVYRALECKIKNIAEASRKTIEVCRLASYGKMHLYPNDPPPYMAFTREQVIDYIHEWQAVQSLGKKKRRAVNLKFGITAKKLFCWMFFTRSLQSRVLTQAYYASVVDLVKDYAHRMDISSEIVEIHGNKATTQIDKYKNVMKSVSLNLPFLRDLFKLHAEYTYAYIRNLEDFLLFLSYEHIPIDHWDALVMPPVVDPAYPPGVYNDSAHTAIAEALRVLETKSMPGCINVIRETTEDVQLDRLVRMKKIESRESGEVDDTSERLYGHISVSVPTYLQMKLYCDWLVFATEEIDHKEERVERDRLLLDNIKKRIDFAQTMGRKVILHARDGSTMQAKVKKRSAEE